MIPRPTPIKPADPINLSSRGREFMFAWLSGIRGYTGAAPTEDHWREAYGRAADYQTVVAARELLASERAAVA